MKKNLTFFNRIIFTIGFLMVLLVVKAQQDNNVSLDSLEQEILKLLDEKVKVDKKTYSAISFEVYEWGNYGNKKYIIHRRQLDSIYFENHCIYFHSPQIIDENIEISGKPVKTSFVEQTYIFSFVNDEIWKATENQIMLGDFILCGQKTNKLYDYFMTYKGCVFDIELELFSRNLEKYNRQPEKFAIAEEQRRLIVQANAANEEKNYEAAINLFNKALEVDAFSYPQAYFNIALLSAQIKRYGLAIFNMKKYLILVPDAPDARAAQDMIYEWEGII